METKRLVDLSAADRAKLTAILNLLASDRHGERDAAAFAATRFLQARNLQWRDILGAEAEAEPDAGDDPFAAFPDGWRRAAYMCAKYGADTLTAWELGFAVSLAGYVRISPRQAEVLLRLWQKLELAGVAP